MSDENKLEDPIYKQIEEVALDERKKKRSSRKNSSFASGK